MFKNFMHSSREKSFLGTGNQYHGVGKMTSRACKKEKRKLKKWKLLR